MNKFLIILLSSPLFFELSATNIFNQGNEVLAAEKAFIINKLMGSENIIITWDIVDGYYMYFDSIKVMENKNTLPYKIINSSQSKYNDDFFGESIILKKNLSIHIKKKDLSAIDSALVYYQGCSEAGFCYPVQKSYLR